MKSRTIGLFAGALVTLSSVFVLGQRDLRAQSTSGSIVGTIRDAAGSAVPEVSLRIANLQDNTARTIVSGAAGEYQVSGLAPGLYEIVAAKAGFSFPQLFAVTLNAGQQLRADFKVSAADPGLTSAVEQKLDATEKRIEQLEAELPPIDGATAQSGTPYFTENPGQRAHMWDSTINIPYMPKEHFTWWLEVGYRHSDIPYFAGREGVTPPGGDNLYPQYYTCTSGVSSMQGSFPAAQAACGGASDVWFPDLRRSQASASAGLLVRF